MRNIFDCDDDFVEDNEPFALDAAQLAFFNKFHKNGKLIDGYQISGINSYYRKRVLTCFYIALVQVVENRYLKSTKDDEAKMEFVSSVINAKSSTDEIALYQDENGITTKDLFANFDIYLEKAEELLEKMSKDIPEFASEDWIDLFLNNREVIDNHSRQRKLVKSLRGYRVWLKANRYI